MPTITEKKTYVVLATGRATSISSLYFVID